MELKSNHKNQPHIKHILFFQTLRQIQKQKELNFTNTKVQPNKKNKT
jgi:hypothetical protein